jgi:type I restriction enzyme S subunit
MSFPRYPKYKASGVEWLGDVPEHWTSRPLRSIGFAYGGLTGKTADHFTEDGPYTSHFIPFTNILNNTVVRSDRLDPVQVEPGDVQNEVRTGDLLFLMSSEDYDYLGFSAVVRQIPAGTLLNSFCKGFRPTAPDVSSEYLNYFCRSSFGRALISRLGFGFTRINLRTGALLSIPVLFPTLAEQRAIAAFLDRETKKIDELVAEQERLIELLKEKRQAVISHAVTKGLDPAAPMKPSGVEWLGEVPAHWEMRRLKQACTATPSNVDKKSHEGEEQVRLCNYVDVYYNDEITEAIDFMVATASDAQIAKFTLRAGDTIITKDSETADDIAIAAFVPRDLPGVVCGYHLSMIRPKRSADGRFIKWLFGSRYAKGCFAVRANGLTRVGLGQHDLENIDFAFPPLEEQRAIAAFLDRETDKIDTLVTQAESVISLLIERRSALISAAVTGQIDVRNAVPSANPTEAA